MPQRIQMFLPNGNNSAMMQRQINQPALGANPSIAAPKAPSALNAPFISRIHNVRPGCGSCGRH